MTRSKKCKSKNCNTILPMWSKSKYCENCLNKKSDRTRIILKSISGLLTGCIALFVWIDKKKNKN